MAILAALPLTELNRPKAQTDGCEIALCMHNGLNRCATHFNGMPTEIVTAKGMKARWKFSQNGMNHEARRTRCFNGYGDVIDVAAKELSLHSSMVGLEKLMCVVVCQCCKCMVAFVLAVCFEMLWMQAIVAASYVAAFFKA